MQHVVNLPYENDFDECQIPTKAGPIQMNEILEKRCREEIQYLKWKGLISKSRSSWSCAAFYVNKNSEIERGILFFIENFKPPNLRAGAFHGGLTFGSLVIVHSIKTIEVMEMLQQIAEYYQSNGFEEIVYKAIPYVFAKYPSQEDIYSIIRKAIAYLV